METYHQLDVRETELFWTKIWQPKNNEEAEWIKYVTKEIRLEKDPKAEI